MFSGKNVPGNSTNAIVDCCHHYFNGKLRRTQTNARRVYSNHRHCTMCDVRCSCLVITRFYHTRITNRRLHRSKNSSQWLIIRNFECMPFAFGPIDIKCQKYEFALWDYESKHFHPNVDELRDAYFENCSHVVCFKTERPKMQQQQQQKWQQRQGLRPKMLANQQQ